MTKPQRDQLERAAVECKRATTDCTRTSEAFAAIGEFFRLVVEELEELDELDGEFNTEAPTQPGPG